MSWIGNRASGARSYLSTPWPYVFTASAIVYCGGIVDRKIWEVGGQLALPLVAGYSLSLYANYIKYVRHAKHVMSWAERLPTSMHLMEPDESGKRTVALNYSNGDMSTIEVPADYAPTDDGGALLLGELFGDPALVPDDIKEIWTRLFSR